ncbi:tRNA guanosine(34) transglycosylase Tgt [Thermosulfuriphilus sp.]
MGCFEILKREKATRARLGRLKTRRGEIETPVFMPVGTQATVKSLTPEEVWGLSAKIILANTYHLFLRPGHELIASLGGLHRFMNWPGAILTDSGGFQIYSLAKLTRIEPEGVWFKSHLDGSVRFLTPELAMEIQRALGSDIHMVLDTCIPYPLSLKDTERLTKLTTLWAERSKKAASTESLVFGIVQGGMYEDLRQKSAREIVSIGFDGYAVGGLSVGEPKGLMLAMLEASLAELPEDRPVYLMGVGTPEDIIEAVILGVDMFDCVLPTRNARRGTLFTSEGKIAIKRARFRDDPRPLDERCSCYTCRNFSRAYLRHLFMARELLAYRLNTIHNLHFYLELMRKIRQAIKEDRLMDLRETILRKEEKT